MIGVILGTGWRGAYPPVVGWREQDDLVFIERRHLYEGFTADECVANIRYAHLAAGLDALVLTNACGAVNPDLEVGEIVNISDHLNLTGTCPDVGFQTCADIYLPVERLRRGVFAQVKGPAFESPAEARWLRTIGADVVGMSTAIEAIYAHHLGVPVVGLSLVTDVAGTSAGHPEVLAIAAEIDLAGVLDGILSDLRPGTYSENGTHSQQVGG